MEAERRRQPEEEQKAERRRQPLEAQKAVERVSVVPWMRCPVDIDLFQPCPLPLLPGLDPRLVDALKNNLRIESLFPVQVAVWLETIGPGDFERDICVNSPTGSGKTLAYALPIVQKLSTRKIKCLRALIVLPTRDLAKQVKKVFDAIAPSVGLCVGLSIGQSSIEDDLINSSKPEMSTSFDPDALYAELQSSVDILVATPGRLMDHINSTKGFTLEHLCYLVVDETDRLLREAYQSWLPTVIKLTSSNDEAMLSQTSSVCSMLGPLTTIRRCGIERGFKGKKYPRLAKMILSATLTQDPSKLSELDLHHPLFLASGNKRYKLPETLESYRLICGSKLKPLYLVALLRDLKAEKCIVFTSSVESTRKLHTLLKYFEDLPFKIREYSGLQHQSLRSKTLKTFREGKIEVLIATDGLTRGTDVEGVENVISYDMPRYVKTYIHRAGRTARAGQAGRCFTLLNKDEVKKFNKILQKAGDKSCRDHSLPVDLLEHFRPIFLSAVEKRKLKAARKPGLELKSVEQHRP